MGLTLGTQITGAVQTNYVVASETVATGYILSMTSGAAHNFNIDRSSASLFLDNDVANLGTNFSDANPHVFSGRLNSASSWVQLDATRVSGNLSTSGNTSTGMLGAYSGGPSFYAVMHWLCDLSYSGAITDADDTTIRSILKTTSGTP